MLCPHEQAPAAYGRKLRGQAMDRLAPGPREGDAARSSRRNAKRRAQNFCSVTQEAGLSDVFDSTDH